MAELNYSAMRKKLELEKPEKKVKIVGYLKDKAPKELDGYDATGSVGELFPFKDSVFIGLGSLDKKDNPIGFLPSINILRAMATLYKKISLNYKKSEITFDEKSFDKHLKDAYYGFVLASYS